jgi:hypothetical protein
VTHAPRYRVEDGQSVIDIRLRQSRQLFDSRDPAPFRERDLDEEAVDYLLGAAEEIARHHPLRIVITIAEEPEPRMDPALIVEAIQAHFTHERRQIERRLREHVRRGQLVLLLGVTVLVVFLTLAQWMASLPTTPLRAVLREGLVITGWVAMWRPLEVLLFDWWPLVDQRRHIARILAARILVHYEP